MSAADITSTMVFAILPEIGLVILAGLVLALDVIWRGTKSHRLGYFTVAGLVVVILISIFTARPPDEGILVWGGMLRMDMAGFLFRLVFMVGAAITALFATQVENLYLRGEFYGMLLISTLGMSLMASSADLIMLFLAVETTSLPLYVMAGFKIRSQKSVEAGIKYLLFGAMTSSVMVYGFSLLYGITGSTSLYNLPSLLSSAQVPTGLLAAIMGLVAVGFAFKVSAVPFHFWAPDVYQGAPTPVAGFLSTASKAAGFAALIRVFQVAFSDQAAFWTVLIAILAAASMFLGNYLALAQKSLKRLLAYSSIAQAGYMLIGVASGTPLGMEGAIYYLMAYLVTNLAAFGIVTLVESVVGSDEISALAGLSRRAPGLALAMLVALLSLGGIPPFAGFFAKLLVFASAIETNQIWLVLVGIFNAIVGLYYYLNVLKVMYLNPAESDTPLKSKTGAWRVALVLCVVGILVLGVWFTPWFSLAQDATRAIWIY